MPLTHQLFRSELPRNPRCRCPHEQWETRDVDEPLSGVSLSGLASRAGCKKGECQVRGEAHWFSESPCQACGTSTPVRRFAPWFRGGVGRLSLWRVSHRFAGGGPLHTPFQRRRGLLGSAAAGTRSPGREKLWGLPAAKGGPTFSCPVSWLSRLQQRNGPGISRGNNSMVDSAGSHHRRLTSRAG